jgi:hypothetical protein
MTYAMGEERGDNTKERDLESGEFWDELSSVFDVTLELLRESAAEHGIDIDNLDTDGVAEEEERIDKNAREHPIAKASLAYIKTTDKWLKDAEGLFKQKQQELEREVRLDLPGGNPQLAAIQVGDAVDVIGWYHTMIYPKMMRALGQSRDEKEWEDTEDFPKDSDGSAKVALISVDRSIGAWGALREHFPSEADTILDFLVHLERLRKAIESQFPDARAFQRVGFDYMPDDQPA